MTTELVELADKGLDMKDEQENTEVEQLERDAKRYRYLRKHHLSNPLKD